MKQLIPVIAFIILLMASACQNKSKSNSQQKTMENEKVETLTLNKENIFFKGLGTEPFWNIQMDSNIIYFTSMIEGLEELSAPLSKPIHVADANIKQYRASTKSGEIQLEIAHGSCSDNMSDTEYTYIVKVKIRKGTDKEFSTLSGCGNYITDFRLTAIWVLDSLYGRLVSITDFDKEFPRMEINSKTNTFSGHAGCNAMNGKLFFENNLLRFTDIATTRKMCRPTNKEVEFLKALRSSINYKIENNRLTLSNPNGTTAVFKKTD